MRALAYPGYVGVEVFPKTELKKSSFVIGEKFDDQPKVLDKLTNSSEGISFDGL